MQALIPLVRGREPLSRQIYAAARHGVLAGRLRRRRAPAVDARPRRAARRVAHRRRARLRAAALRGLRRRRRGAGTYVPAGSPRAAPGPAPPPAQPRLSRGSAPSPPTCARRWSSRRRVRRRRASTSPTAAATSTAFPSSTGGGSCSAARGGPRSAASTTATPPASSPCARRSPRTCARSRVGRCAAAQVVVVNGSQQALDLVARVLVERRRRAWCIEDPGYQGTRACLRAAGARVRPVPVDREGLDVRRAAARGARLLFVTPSHQFPTGAVLPLSRRLGAARRGPSAPAPASSRTTTTASSATTAARSSRCRGSTAAAACSTSARSRRCSSRRCGSATWSRRRRSPRRSRRPRGPSTGSRRRSTRRCSRTFVAERPTSRATCAGCAPLRPSAATRSSTRCGVTSAIGWR